MFWNLLNAGAVLGVLFGVICKDFNKRETMGAGLQANNLL